MAIISELSADYKDFLIKCTPSIQDNIVSAFNNEMARNHRRKDFVKSVHHLDPILLSLENTKIELTNLKLAWLPDFKVVNLALDLTQLCLNVDFKLGDLTVDGNYEINNITLQKVLPVFGCGDIKVNFSDVSVRGRIGLFIQGDSFVPGNYDIEYQWNESNVIVSPEVNYSVNESTKIENKITSKIGEHVIAEKISLQLKEILTEILHDQLVAVIIEYSVTESLADKDEELRQFSKSQISKGNSLFDSLLCTAKDYLVQKDYRSISTDSFTVTYRGKLSSTDQGEFTSGQGYIQDLSTLSRLTDLSLYEEENRFVVYGSLTLREFKHGYEEITTEYENNKLNGNMKAQIYVNSFFMKLSFEKTGNGNVHLVPKIEKLDTRTLGDIEIDNSDLGSLSWLIPKTQKWLTGHLRANAIDTLLQQILAAFQYAIDRQQQQQQQQAAQHRSLEKSDDNNGANPKLWKMFTGKS